VLITLRTPGSGSCRYVAREVPDDRRDVCGSARLDNWRANAIDIPVRYKQPHYIMRAEPLVRHDMNGRGIACRSLFAAQRGRLTPGFCPGANRLAEQLLLEGRNRLCGARAARAIDSTRRRRKAAR